MATKLKTATLVTKITEKINLNGKDFGNTTTKTISSIKDVSQRIIRVLSAENGTQLYSGGAAVGPGTFISTNVEYIRITNLDTSNYITLNIWQDATHQAAFRLLAGESFILGETLGFDVSTDIDSVGAGVTFTKIEALANSANVDVEVFVASK